MPLTCDPEGIWQLFVLLKKKKSFLNWGGAGRREKALEWENSLFKLFIFSVFCLTKPIPNWLIICALPGLWLNYTPPSYLSPSFAAKCLLFLLQKREEKTQISSLWLPKRGWWGPGLILVSLKANNGVSACLSGEHTMLRALWAFYEKTFLSELLARGSQDSKVEGLNRKKYGEWTGLRSSLEAIKPSTGTGKVPEGKRKSVKLHC